MNECEGEGGERERERESSEFVSVCINHVGDITRQGKNENMPPTRKC